MSDNKIWDATAVISITLLVGVTMFAVIKMLDKFDEPIRIDLKELEDTAYGGELREFTMIGRRFAENHQYNKTDYNCVDYSEDFYNIATQLGFTVEQVTGCPAENETGICHRSIRLKVDYELITGYITDYSKQYPRGQEVVK